MWCVPAAERFRSAGPTCSHSPKPPVTLLTSRRPAASKQARGDGRASAALAVHRDRLIGGDLGHPVLQLARGGCEPRPECGPRPIRCAPGHRARPARAAWRRDRPPTAAAPRPSDPSFAAPELERLGAEVAAYTRSSPIMRRLWMIRSSDSGARRIDEEVQIPVVGQQRPGPGRETLVEGNVQGARDVPGREIGRGTGVHDDGARGEQGGETVLGDALRHGDRRRAAAGPPGSFVSSPRNSAAAPVVPSSTRRTNSSSSLTSKRPVEAALVPDGGLGHRAHALPAGAAGAVPRPDLQMIRQRLEPGEAPEELARARRPRSLLTWPPSPADRGGRRRSRKRNRR